MKNYALDSVMSNVEMEVHGSIYPKDRVIALFYPKMAIIRHEFDQDGLIAILDSIIESRADISEEAVNLRTHCSKPTGTFHVRLTEGLYLAIAELSFLTSVAEVAAA